MSPLSVSVSVAVTGAPMLVAVAVFSATLWVAVLPANSGALLSDGGSPATRTMLTVTDLAVWVEPLPPSV